LNALIPPTSPSAVEATSPRLHKPPRQGRQWHKADPSASRDHRRVPLRGFDSPAKNTRSELTKDFSGMMIRRRPLDQGEYGWSWWTRLS
jgi:hypothetical protein